MAIVLWPAGGWAQGGVPATFMPSIDQKVDARSAPAKVTSEEESALTSKGYVNIGSINAWRPGEKEDADITGQLRAAILKKAAEAGGDVVRFEKEGVPETLEVPTGKFKTKGATCDQYQSVATSTTSSSTSCYTDVHGFQHCMTTNTPGFGTAQRCVKWSGGQSVPITKREKSLVSVGTVWRYDPNLAADVARAAEAAREAARSKDAAAAEAARKAQASKEAFAPLHEKLSKAEYAEAELLLANGANANARDEDGRPHLYWEALDGQRSGVELLLAHGADINAKGNDGGTPLDIAVIKGNADMVELLLAHGADVDGKDHLGRTPLYYARTKEVAERLLAHGADVNARGSDGGTPLRAATKDVAELLLAHGADVNAKDNDGQTPLHSAASAGARDVVELLLAHGADVNAQDRYTETALTYAKIMGHKDVAKILRQHGGRERPD
jgi:ankyrin repeat protein